MGQGRLTDIDRSAEWPEALKKVAAARKLSTDADAPIVIEMSDDDAAGRLTRLLEAQHITTVNDNYDEQFAELVVSRHPQLYRSSYEVKKESLKQYVADHVNGRPAWQLGTWVYYPWSGALVHVLERDLFFESRTIRNKNLLLDEEQKAYADFVVGCAGMSVGSNVALSLGLTTGSVKLKIADGAVISASNLNRIVAGVESVGVSKSLVVARRMYEMNPYATVRRYGELNDTDLQSFFDDEWPLQAVVDEIDDLEMKVRLRVEAKKRGIPVIMATDLGDDVMLDIERFDLDRKLPLFHGLVDNAEELLSRKVGKQEWMKYAMQIIGVKNVPLDLQKSLLKVGTQLVTQPQLGGTALMSGVAAAYAVRQIALGVPLKSGRVIVSFDQKLRKDIGTFAYRREVKAHTKELERALRSM